MNLNNVFETAILDVLCNADNDAIYQDAIAHSQQHKSEKLSNVGGYQGHEFTSATLFQQIKNWVPQQPHRPLKSFDIQAWLNINNTHDWNDIHTHSDEGVLISGVYYVKTPANCGRIRMYDPRYLKGKNRYDAYYFEGRGDYFAITPQQGLMLFFPPWLPHMVEPNAAQEPRISVAFNIINATF